MSWRRTGAGLVVGTVIVGSFAGCASANDTGGSHPYSSVEVVPHDPLVAARSLPDVATWVLEEADEDCGTVAVRDDGSLPAGAVQCLTEAVEVGATARLAWVMSTAEGDPLPHFARASGERVLVASTSEYDPYSSDGWHQYECASPEDVPSGKSCVSLR